MKCPPIVENVEQNIRIQKSVLVRNTYAHVPRHIGYVLRIVLQGIRTQIVKINSFLRERRTDISDVLNTFSYTPDMGILWYIIIFWLKQGTFSQIRFWKKFLIFLGQNFFRNFFFISKIFFEIFWNFFFRFKFLFGLIYGEKNFFEKISKKILTQKN